MLRRTIAITAAIVVVAGGGIAGARSFPAPVPEPAPIVRAEVQPPAEPGEGEPSAAPDPYPEPEVAPDPDEDTPARTLKDQRLALFRSMQRSLDLDGDQLSEVTRIFEGSPYLGQGNPAVARHGMKRSECRRIRAEAGLHQTKHAPCARKNMVPLYDPEAGETEADAKVCIDQFEFPDIACEYPVVHVTAREAAQLCEAEGKRICDAHEWEGACAGALHTPEEEYAFGGTRTESTHRHNLNREVRWAYGFERNLGLCATDMPKTAGCMGGGWKECGSNTYPSGAFPACVSPFGVYDQHGNAAEHMNLPLAPEELASRGGNGATEMKGSWFVFQRQDAHPDDCRWRAPDWHPSRLMSTESHENYHLGFRCCADVPAAEPDPAG